MGCFGFCGAGKQPEQHPAQRSARLRGRGNRRLRHGLSRATEGTGGPQSTLSESEWHDARDNFSISGDEDELTTHSAGLSPRHSINLDSHNYAEFRSPRQSDGDELGEARNGEDDAASTSGLGARLASCLPMVRAGESTTGFDKGHRTPRTLTSRARPPAGCTLQRIPVGLPPDAACWCWGEVDCTTYKVRSVDYMKTKQKVSSSKAIYRLAAVDLFSTPQKAYHVAKGMQLPAAPPPLVLPGSSAGESAVLPSVIIFNVQLPNYPAPFFGGNDGPGQSIVYYFVLPDDFDPAKFENQQALGLLQRFVSNGREADGSPTRERLKMIARVVNVDEWAEKGPLSNTEYKLLVNYNEKPVMTRPQQSFYVGQNYLEVDLDVHSYAFLARKALNSYHSRLKDVVWENAFVLQGNTADELPEQVLGAGRIYRVDFEKVQLLEEMVSGRGTTSHPGNALPGGGSPTGTPDMANGFKTF